MDRRDFLALRKQPKTNPVVHTDAVRTWSGINPYTGPWTKTEVIHLLKRTMFGAKISDVNYFSGLTLDQAVDELLQIDNTPPPPPLKSYNNNDIATGDPELGIAEGQTWVNTTTYDGTANFKRRRSFKAWWTGLILNQDRNVREKMLLFWHNHFATQSNEVDLAIWSYNHHKLLRQNVVGNFKDLVKQVTLDVAMLRYLNGYLNNKTAPDENYSRELQELFTLGKENNPNYNEQDVKEAARVLTGWKIDYTNNVAYFDAGQHDTGNKTFSSFYNNTTITGRSGATAGMQELDDLLNMIFSKQVEVSRYLVKKLYRHFIYYKIDSATEINVIEPLALLLRNSNWEIKPVLETLLKSDHFFDVANRGCYIKSPIEFATGLCREFNVAFPNASDISKQYNMWGFIQDVGTVLQQDIGDPPDVAGWKAFYQTPQFYEIWINSDTLPFRNLFTDIMVLSGYTQGGNTLIIDPVAFTKDLPNPQDPNQLIDDALDILYRVDVSATAKAAIKTQALLTGQTQDHYWTNAWNSYIADPNPQTFQVVYTRLRNLYKYFMNLSEYQLS